MNYGLTTWTQPTGQFGGAVNLYVAGMKQSTVYHMRGVVEFADGTQFTDTDQTFTTGALPAICADHHHHDNAWYDATERSRTARFGFDRLHATFLSGGDGLRRQRSLGLSAHSSWSWSKPRQAAAKRPFPDRFSGQPDGANFAMQEVDLGGNIIWQMTAAQLNQALAAATCAGCNITVIGAHHDFVMLPNGHLILIASTTQVVSGTTVTGDVLIDVGDMDTNLVPRPVWLWNEFDHLDITRQPYLYPDWTHTNAVLYSPDDGNLIISMRHQNWLVKIDYANGTGTGNILWHLGYQGDFTLLNADGSTDTNATDWFYAQHGPSFVTPNTSGKFSLVLFDNGDDRGVSIVAGGTCGVAGQPACYSTVPLLELDETAMTATLVFHPTTLDYSFFGGNAEVLKNGNIEYDECGSTPPPANNAKIVEVTQASPSQTVWQMQIAGQYAYRGFRMPSLYPGVQWWRGVLAPIRFVKDANLRSKLGEEFRRAVRRTVVDDHNLPVTGGKILIQGACDGLFDQGFMVVGVYDYADKRFRHSVISMTRRV